MKSDTTKQPLEVDGIVPFNSLKVGEQFRFTTDGENIVRTISQIGRTEIYCPIDGSNTMGHSKAGGEEVYAKSDKHVIKLIPITDSKEGLHTQGEWKVLPEPKNDRFYIVCGNDWVGATWTYIRDGKLSEEEAKANAELIVKAVNFYNKLPRLAPDSEVPLPNDEYFLKAVNERKALLDALKACYNCLTMDSDMEEDFAPEIKQVKKLLDKAGW